VNFLKCPLNFYFEIRCFNFDWKITITLLHSHRNTQQWQVRLKSVLFWIFLNFKNILKFTNFSEYRPGTMSAVCVASASVVWIGFPQTTQDCRREKIWSPNTFRAIVQFTRPRQTRRRQDCFVVSGVAVWIESARPPDRCVLCLVCIGVRRAVAPVAQAMPPRRRPARGPIYKISYDLS